MPANNEIVVQPVALGKVLGPNCIYSIPHYQRPYAWKEEHMSDLFDDVYKAFTNGGGGDGKGPPYFLGSLVLIREPDQFGKPFEVIDGQQRLTSLTILFSAIRAEYYNSGSPEQNRLQSLNTRISELGDEEMGVPISHRITLSDEKDNEFFRKYIQESPPEFGQLEGFRPGDAKGESQKNIVRNALSVLRRLRKYFGAEAQKGLVRTPEVSNVERLLRFSQFLSRKCELVPMVASDVNAAIRIFSVLNTRGLDLKMSDIVKTKILQRIGPSRKRDIASKNWRSIEKTVGRDRIDDFLRDIRMLHDPRRVRERFVDEFEEAVLKGRGGREVEFVNTYMHEQMTYFLIARDSSYEDPSREEGREQVSEPECNINNLLGLLPTLKNWDWVPPFMCFLSKDPDALRVEPFVRKLERLAVCMKITGTGWDGRISRYADVLRDIPKSNGNLASIEELEISSEEKERFKAALSGDVYNLPSGIGRYIVLRLNHFMSEGGQRLDFKRRVTLEHVLPQEIEGSEGWGEIFTEDDHKKWVHRLANLVPLPPKKNSQASNYSFQEKEKVYRGGRGGGVTSYALTVDALDESEWTPDVLKKRQDRLLALAHKKWELD